MNLSQLSRAAARTAAEKSRQPYRFLRIVSRKPAGRTRGAPRTRTDGRRAWYGPTLFSARAVRETGFLGEKAVRAVQPPGFLGAARLGLVQRGAFLGAASRDRYSPRVFSAVGLPASFCRPQAALTPARPCRERPGRPWFPRPPRTQATRQRPSSRRADAQGRDPCR